MAIIFSDNIENRSPKPLDARTIVDAYEFLSAIEYKHDGMIVYVKNDKLHYIWNEGTNKWSVINLTADELIDGGYF